MLRELITWVLNTYLGKYLENFNPAQLTVALLSGEVELENVPLRKDALRGLGLPLQALSGSIGKIKLQVPVRQFRSAPWCIIIERVYVIIGPKNLDEWDDDKEKKADHEYKLSQIDDIEAKWRAQKEAALESGYYASSYSGWLSYGAGLATNIIENLQLKINDVHIRYEDSITIPKSRFACGITIESLSAQSCDANWNPGFTAAWSQCAASFKLVELKSFGFYWDRLTNDKMFGSVSSIDLASAMQAANCGKDHGYIIKPISAQAHFKRDLSETPLRTRSRPRLSCDVTVNEIHFNLSDFQYTQMAECIRGLDNISKYHRYRVLRPPESVKGNAKQWWQYAARCHGFRYQTSEEKFLKAKENLHYIKICTKLVLNPSEHLSQADKDLKAEVEMSRDFDELRVLREISLLQVPINLKLKGQDGAQGKGMLFQWFPQWWGWYGNSTSNNSTPPISPNGTYSETSSIYSELPDMDDQAMLEDEILNALEGSVDNTSLLKRDAVFGKFDFSLDSGQLNICSEKYNTADVVTMMELHFDNLKLNIETRPRSGSHLIGLSLGSVCVKDLITPNTEYPDLIRPQMKEENWNYYRFQSQRMKKDIPTPDPAEATSEPWFQLQYERKPLQYNTDYRLVVKSKSLDVVYNMGALKWLIDFFAKPLQVLSARQKIEAMKYSTKMKLIKNWKSMLEGDLGQRKSWSLEIDVSAPQIILVENFSNRNTSMVLVDFGRFQLLKNSAQDRIRQHKFKDITTQSESIASKLSHGDSEEDDAFMTPCSTPPGSENSPSDSQTLCSTVENLQDVIINEETGLENAFHDKIYDKYTIDLTDLQVLVCKGRERWGFASTKGSSPLHVLDRFSISLQLERRVVHTADPEYPSLTLYGTLPKLVAHVNEHKIGAVCDILDIITADTYQTQSAIENVASILETSEEANTEKESSGEKVEDKSELRQKDTANLIVLQFAIDQMSLEVQSRGRSIAELQVTGVKAGLSKRSLETNITLSVHGLLLVDAIQSFGPDFELLVASHRHVGMDSVSGSLKQSEPCSPTSPGSPDPQQERPTSPQTLSKAISSLQRVNSATWSTLGDLDALITVEVHFVTPVDGSDRLQIANINFNNLDIIANQETIVELLGFLNRVFPGSKHMKVDPVSKTPDVDEKPITKNELQIYPVKTEITFDFHRLNVLVLRALMRDSFLVGRKVGTFTMSEAKIHATLGPEVSVEGSLGGLQILDLTPEGVNHQRILSVGKDPLTEPPDLEQDLLSTLTQEIYGPNKDEVHQRQALSFSVSRNIEAVVSIKIRMASVWYTHCARFMQELSWCATEFKHYLKNIAKSIRDKATDMAYGLVQPVEEGQDSAFGTQSEKLKLHYPCKSPQRSTKKKRRSKKVVINLDVVLDTPVLVVPRSSCSAQVIVAHLGKISVSNQQQAVIPKNEARQPSFEDRDIFTIDEEDSFIFEGGNEFKMDDEQEFSREYQSNENNFQNNVPSQDTYAIDVRNMNLFSLDTSRRKGFRMSALPRAEDFYSCQQDAVAILHDTAIRIQVIKCTEDSKTFSVSGEHEENSFIIEGSVTQPLHISLSRKQYEQLLETADNIFKVPNDLVRPPAQVSVNQNIDVVDSVAVNSYDFEKKTLKDSRYVSGVLDEKKELEVKVAFTLPIFIIQLKNEHDNPMIEISFREFSVHYEKSNLYETHIQVSLRSILMEDLLCPTDSKYRQMVISSPRDQKAERHGAGYSSASCPDLVRLQIGCDIPTGSLPDNLESSAGFEKTATQQSAGTNYNRSRLNVNQSLCPDTPPPSPQPRCTEDNLVIYSALLVDSDCPSLATQYKGLKQISSIDFNCLDLIISVERWFLLLNFFGLFDEEDDRTKREGRETPAVREQSKGKTELEITVRSLNLVLMRNEGELAKVNISNAFFVVSKYDVSKIVEGRLGSVSLFDLTSYGSIYRERCLTSGAEALKFIYKRHSEKNNQRSLNKDAKLKIYTSSVRYVHTKRFIMEIHMFFKEFLQLQTPVMRKIKSTDNRYSLQQRPTQLGLEINAGSPIILLPLSFDSNQVIVADLGEFSLKNSFHLASEQDVITRKTESSPLDEILDVMQIDLVNTNLFTGDRCPKSADVSEIDQDNICLDMGSYWIMKKGDSLLKEKCHLKLQIERNMDYWKSHSCPDVSVQGTLSRLEGVLDIEQYKLVRGFLVYNLGEPIDDIYNSNSFSLAESRLNLNIIEIEKIPDDLIWTNMSINLDLEDVSLVLNWLPGMVPSSASQSLACINFIKSCLKIDSFSDGSQDIDLVSQEILIMDYRFQNQASPKNVFTNILQPIRKQSGSNLVQAEIHSRKRNDHSKFTILLNNMRLMAIIDWIENIQDYLSQNAEISSASLLRSHASEVSSMTTLSVEKTPIEVILNITDSELVFVEKTDQIDTNSIILKSTTVVSFKPSDVLKPVAINLNHLEVFSCILGYENETALSIIDPITINVDVKNQNIEVQIQKQFCIRLSYHDVKMFTRMLQSLPKQTRTAQTSKENKSNRGNEWYSSSTEKLCALGFKRSDCMRALEICGYQIDEAAIWLTKNTEPVKLLTTQENQINPFEIHSIVIHALCISICVIDDCKDADVPLLELSLSQLEFKQELSKYLFSQSAMSVMGVSGFCSGHLKAIIASDYYNRNLSGWEPVIEPWECISNWNYSLSQTGNECSRLNLHVCSDKLLKFNITSTLIELWQLVRKNWTQDYYEGSNTSNGAGVVQSPSGFRRRTPFVPFALRNNTGEDLWFKILLTLPGGITRTEVATGDIISNWVKVEPNETLPFSFSQQNKLRHMDSHKLNLHQVLVHVEGWSQVGPVSVDRVGTFFRHSHREGTQFSAMPKARIVFAVTLEGSAQKLVTVRSALKVINRLEDVVLLKMDHPMNYLGTPDWPNAKTAVVAPSDTFSVPLSHVHASIFFKPLPSLINAMDEKNGNTPYTEINSTNGFNDNDFWNKYNSGRKSLTGGRYFQFCDHSIHWRECDGNDLRQEQRTCKGNREKDYNVVATIRRDGYPQKEITSLPGHTIILMPPLRINNLLCCDLLYKISNHTQGRIQSSSTANIYEISLEEPINLSITLDGYRVSGQLSIPAGHLGMVEPKLRLMDVHSRDLHLRASIQSIKGNGMEISISAPFWLVNKTGLPLVFRQEGVSHAASGQFEEHEKARVVSPLMFSFSDPDASPALEVRLGNRYGANPPWCQGINLHKDIMHRQLKTGISNETFVIGVEVRRGRGRYSRTSVVTFSPRFQLYNRSSHKLQFAQKCFVMKPANPEARRTIIEAVPGCHFPFHWPRSDQEPLLCVKLSDVENCCWSHGIPINEGQSLYINIRNECGEMHFLRLEVILQGATYFLLFGDARKLPPPIRLDNYSEVPIKFFQYGCKPEWRSVVKPHSTVSYALDDPMGSQCLQIEAPGGDSYVYSLRDLNMSNMLTYSNFIYIAFKGTFQTLSISENLHLSAEFDIESQHLVLGVRDNSVVLMKKCAGDRSQLWLMNSFEQLEHEGSSPPTEPGKKPNITPRLVLDLKRAPNPMDYTSLVVRPANKQRQFTQTWKFSNGRLMCGHANMCVQARNGVFGLRPGSDAVLGRIDSDTHTRFNQSVPIEQLIERQKLRPGSGQLTVSIKMDGPIRTIQIKDVKCSNDIILTPDPLWKHASHVISSSPRTHSINGEQKGAFVDEYFVKVNLSKGLAVSIISKNPCEELAYISLDKILLEAVATPGVRSIDLYVSDMQIDNQLLETPCPILMYTLKSGSSYDLHTPSALTFNAKMLPSPNANAVIFERVVLSLRPFVLYLEERLVLRAADFMGLGSSQHNAATLADESEFEAQQVATKILAANAKRFYFEDLQINPSQIRLSVITVSKLSSQLSETKKKLGLTLIKFEDALIEFNRFADKHHFETLEVYLRAIKSHYKNQLKWHAASILGSVDFLGNPLGFANDLSEGVSGLLFEGSVKSLVKNVTHGISNSTAKLTETISDGLGRVVLDEQDNEARQKILEVPSGANTSGEHLAAGLKGFGFGLLGGVTSIVRHTYEGAQSDGLHGFISGLGKGIVGTVTKPLIGVLDLASETANAVRETSKSAHRVLPERKRLPRCVSGAPGGLLPSYSFTQAKGQQHLHLINKRNFSEQLMSYEPNLLDDRDSKLRLLVSTEYVRIFSRTDEETTIILSCHLSEVLSCHPVTVNKTLDNHKLKKSQYYIEISSSLPNLYKRPRVRCQSEEMAEKASRHINYAKSVYDEREHTLNYDSSMDN